VSVARIVPDRADVALPPPDALDGLLDALAERVAAKVAARVADMLAADPAAPWLDTKQAAAALQVPVSWVAEKARQGQLRSHKLGHYVRFRRVELEADAVALAARAERE